MTRKISKETKDEMDKIAAGQTKIKQKKQKPVDTKDYAMKSITDDGWWNDGSDPALKEDSCKLLPPVTLR